MRRLGPLICLCLALLPFWFSLACTQSTTTADNTTPAPTGSAAVQACDAYCAEACDEVKTEECAYETQASCEADCLPGCESGAVKPEVAACEAASGGAGVFGGQPKPNGGGVK